MNGYYSFQFPEYLIPEGSRIVVYGAHDMGRDYAEHILKTGYCQILAFADKAKAGTHLYRFDIVSPAQVLLIPFDYILIASTNYHKEVRAFLCELGIDDDRIRYAEIRRLAPSPSVISNQCLEYFVAQSEGRKLESDFMSHPIHRILLEALQQYTYANILDSAGATKALMENVKACDEKAMLYPYEDERYFYGNAFTLMSYCGYRCADLNALPSIHHGVLERRADSYMPAYSPILISTIYQRRYYDLPIIEVGPYIRYTKPYLSDSQTEVMKNKLGRTLTAFPMHNDLYWNTDYNVKQFDDFLFEQKNRYDSVFICLHVFDLTDEKIRYYKDHGVTPVSLGVRMDQLYLSRLRSLLELSDMVVTNYIGAVLNHATALKKAVMWLEPDSVVVDGVPKWQKVPEYEEQKRKLTHLLRHEEVLSQPAVDCCEDFFRQKTFRSPEEMYAIFEMNEEIYHLSHGDRYLFRECTRSYREGLKDSPKPGASLKYRILQECVQD